MEIQLVFENDFSNRKFQISIKKQLLAILICIKSYRNIIFSAKIRNLYKIRKNIVDKIYCQVIIVIQSSNLQTIHVR